MADESDQKAIIMLAQAMGEVSSGVKSLQREIQETKQEVRDLKDDYLAGREKAKEAHAQTIAVLGEKMDRSEFLNNYKGVVKIQWLWDNWSIILIIIGLLVGGGWLKYGEKWQRTKHEKQQERQRDQQERPRR